MLLINLQFTAWPEMFSYPYFKNNGFLLYKDMIHPYPPILTLFLGVMYKFFGYKLIVLKLITWAMILLNDILIYLIVKKLTGKNTFALLSLFFYLLVQPVLDGNQLWFDLAIVPPILFSIYYLLQKKYFWSGLFLGIAVFTKQTVGIFLIFISLFLLIKNKNFKDLFYFLVGPSVLFLVLLTRLATEGAISGFFDWTIIYPFTYWSKFPGYVQMALTTREWIVVILLSFPALLLLLRKKYILYCLFYILSLVLVYPRFSFFHLQLAIAFWAILLGFAVRLLKPNFLFLTSYFLLMAIFIVQPLIRTNWQKETRFFSRDDFRLAEEIRKLEGKVYLLGPHSGLYVLADKLPPKPWVDNFGWYWEIPGIKENIIASWTQNPPDVIVLTVPGHGNWFDLGVYRPQNLLEWIKDEKIKNIVLK